jgi:hypothetical protein
MLKGQDILLMMKLAVGRATPDQNRLAQELFISQSEVAKSYKRCKQASLYADSIGVLKGHLLDAINAIRYYFPGELGSPVVGIPTAWSAQGAFSDIRSNEKIVWPHIGGKERGLKLEPIYKSIPDACALDADLHFAMAAVDALRIGRLREVKIARQYLKKVLT